jgi:sugar (pentulose or hexulose) kinase
LEIYVDKYEKKIEKILISGGGSKSKIWSQIFADVLGIPNIIPTVVETETRGSAILAGYGVGLFSSNQFDLQEDVSVIKPNEKNFDLYGKMFNVYKDLYAKNKESFRLLRNV